LDFLTPDNVKRALIYLSALIVSITVHEFGHAWAATRLGDPLPAAQGRLSLSPVRHIDPIGTILFPLIMFFSSAGLLGWGRPVETNRLSYTRRLSPLFGHVLVSLAGPLMNLLMVGVVSLLLLAAGRLGWISGAMFSQVYAVLVLLNFVLFFLNLLPVPPLDGGALLEWALPRSQQYIVRFLERWGFILLFGLSMLTPVFVYLLAPAGWASNAWQSLLFRMAGL
jgi:Zn-dependent protease